MTSCANSGTYVTPIKTTATRIHTLDTVVVESVGCWAVSVRVFDRECMRAFRHTASSVRVRVLVCGRHRWNAILRKEEEEEEREAGEGSKTGKTRTKHRLRCRLVGAVLREDMMGVSNSETVSRTKMAIIRRMSTVPVVTVVLAIVLSTVVGSVNGFASNRGKVRSTNGVCVQLYNDQHDSGQQHIPTVRYASLVETAICPEAVMDSTILIRPKVSRRSKLDGKEQRDRQQRQQHPRPKEQCLPRTSWGHTNRTHQPSPWITSSCYPQRFV